MEVLYLDLWFGLNLLCDYLLCLLTARAAGLCLKRPRYALAALLGAVYACAAYLPGLALLSLPGWKLLCGALMGWIAFGAEAHPLRCLLLFFAVSASFGGAVDFIIGRIMDVFMSFPMLLCSLIIGIILKASVRTMFLSIGIPCIPMFYRMTRSNTLSVRERGFTKAAVSMGAGHMRIVLRHILPNVLPHILVVFSSAMGGCILAESSLGFLGFGIPQPTPSWGLIVNEGKSFMFQCPWTAGFAGLFIALTVLGFNLLGDGIRDYLDPKIRNSYL